MLNNSVDGDDGSLSTIIDAMAEHTEIPATNKSELCKAEKNFLARKLYASWLVHIFTTTGVLCALYGIVDIFNDRPARALIWLVITQIIDGLDGPMDMCSSSSFVYITFRYVPTWFRINYDELNNDFISAVVFA